ncbi:MAG: GNAT family N-acetyltransferase [Candidatus Saccharicenans sp.]|nr:GNAT family N-acetyltransferase [Candidatus Saccharicenans sp.]
MAQIEVSQVRNNKDFKAFLLFPWKIYENDPNWVPPLLIEMKEKLNRRKNPFFEHAEMELFLAREGEEKVGRIAAIIDHRHNEYHREKVVFFGLYESVNDPEVARALLETVAAWGKERGMDTLRGPMNLSMNDECAFLLEGFDRPPVIMMPYNPPYYNELMEKSGLTKAKDLYAFLMTRDHETMEKVQAVIEKVRQSTSFSLRTVNMKKVYEETRKIAYIYNQAWSKNWGFVPWTEKEMDFMARRLKAFADPELVIFALHEGREVGFALGLPNYNEIIKDLNGRLFPFGIFKLLFNRKRIKGMRATVFGVLPQVQHTGLAYLLYDELERRAKAKGYQWAETSWQLEDNEAINRFTTSIGGRIYKKYRIYEKRPI